jgi:hypothetical protein
MTRDWIVVAGLTLAIASPLHAQHDFFSAMEYSVASPIGDSRRFGAGSWAGANWEGRWMYGPHASFGTLLGFNEFYRRESGTTTFPEGAATGDQYRHLLAIPMLFTASWYIIGQRDDPRWYIGAGAGPQYNEQLYQLGFELRRHSDWAVAFVPEVGLAFQAWYGTGGIVSLRYHLPTESGSFLGSGSQRFPYVSFSVGFGYR